MINETLLNVKFYFLVFIKKTFTIYLEVNL
nr:MAG TPA: hypothetical protein [Caudoviricetes sp.]DAM33067.1 MAG TPA: hypothetical protein [Bacteriophage sp.]DAI51791.1 MAG TPA: hypothetical protein [Caudoviricetes sp.]DAN35876.1 MAG TPA: hypothetical protein [Caudoviricetes sp.]DAN62399.1 MAG TPA: hypothetical protein [Caudoviricetes sp.]